MKRILIAAVLAVLAVRAGAQTYTAWQDEWESVVRQAPLKLGPLRLFPVFTLSNVGYDDNVYFDSRPQPDYTATLSPEIKAYLPIGGTILLSASENPEYAYYVKEAGRRSFLNSYAAGLKMLLLSRFVLSGSYRDYAHRRRVSPEIGAYVTDLGKSWDAGLYYETSGQTAIGLTAFRNDLAYEADFTGPEGVPLSQTLNHVERGARAEIHYRAFYKGYLTLSGGQSEYRFSAPGAAWRDASARQAALAASFPIGGTIEGKVSLGYKQFTPASSGIKPFSGLVGTADLTARLGRLVLRARFSRDSVFSAYSDVLYFIDAGGGAGASLYPFDFLRLDYDYDVGTSDYPDYPGAGEDGAAGGRTDQRRTHSASLVVRVFRTAGLGLTWSSSEWTSTLPDWNRRRSFLGAYLTYRF